MDGVAHEHRRRLETAAAEWPTSGSDLSVLYNLVETADMDVDDFKPRIRDHRERQEQLEARALLSWRRVVLDAR